MVDDAYTRNEDGELAVRTVSTSGDTGTNPNDVFTRDDEGRLAIRTTGGGGGDQHNLGYFATQAALEEAHPTAEAGDWAIVGATDTVWVWDSDNSQWVDSDQKGQVTSVNGQTGTVVLTASDVGALPSTTPIPDFVQYSTMPTASADNLGDIVQFTGTTDANYTNGYFYKCISDGQEPATYSWSQVSVQPAPSGLPDQTGQGGKFLTTDGTDASWSDKPLVNKATAIGLNALTILGNPSSQEFGLNIGARSSASGWAAIALGCYAQATKSGALCIGGEEASGRNAIAIGQGAKATATGAVMINTAGGVKINSNANTLAYANDNGNFEIMSADGTVPTARLTRAINKYSTMPTAASTNEGWIVQFTGTTDSNYTHGYIYECVTDDNTTYYWKQMDVQPSSGGATYTAGTGISIDANNEISVADPVLVNNSTSGVSRLAVGSGASAAQNAATALGVFARANSNGSLAIGYDVRAQGVNSTAINGSAGAQRAIQLGYGGTNSDANTFKVANANGNFEMMDVNGNLPADRLASTTGLADGNYRLRLVMASGVPTLEWVAE